MLDFPYIGYEIRSIFDKMKALAPVKTEGTTGSKVAISIGSSISKSSFSYQQNTSTSSQNLYKKSASKTLHFKFAPLLSTAGEVMQSHVQLKLALGDLWNIYISVYQLINIEKSKSALEFEKIISLIQKLAFKLSILTSQKNSADIINSMKVIHGKIKSAVSEAYQKFLIMKIFNLLEKELNENKIRYVNARESLPSEPFDLKMQKVISFFLTKVIKRYSVQKTISTLEKSFLAKLNPNEISKEFICGIQDVNKMMNLVQEYGGTYLRYFQQQHQTTYGLIGGGCAGLVIHWGIELLLSSSAERGHSSRMLTDSKEMLASFMSQEIPKSIKSLNFLGGEPVFNKQVNLYQLFYDKILSHSTTLKEFNLLSDGQVSKNMFDLFSKDEKESILLVNFENASASASNDQTSHFIGLAKVCSDDNALYYLADAEFGVFDFDDKNKFKEFIEKYCSTIQYAQFNSYLIMDIKPALKKVINHEIVLLSSIDTVVENYSIGIKETDHKIALEAQEELKVQTEEKIPMCKVFH